MKRIGMTLFLLAGLISVTTTGFAQTLDEQTQQALIAALNDEYKAKATYQKVIDTFGEVRPFANIIQAEQTHIDLLLPLFEKYGVPVPEDNQYAEVPEFATLQDALKAGVDAEIANAKLYDDLFATVKEADILAVFTRLRDASQDNHLPAFERALDGGKTGQGQQRNNGNGSGNSDNNSNGSDGNQNGNGNNGNQSGSGNGNRNGGNQNGNGNGKGNGNR